MKSIWSSILLLSCLLSAGARSFRLPPEIREAQAAQRKVERAVRRQAVRKILIFRREIKKKVAGPWERWQAGKLPKRLAAADVVFVDEKLRYVREWDGTEAGGWDRTAEYFFRPSGSLAVLYTELVSTHHRIKVLVREYYDPAGGQLRRFETAHDLFTAATIPELTFLRGQSPVYLTPADFYASIGGLDLSAPRPKEPVQGEAPEEEPQASAAVQGVELQP